MDWRFGSTVLIASAIVILVAAAWLLVAVVAVSEREAVGQTSRDPANTAPAPASPAPASPTPEAASASPAAELDDLLGDRPGSAPSFASASASAPQEIPDLSAMEVIGNLKHFSVGVNFSCASPTGTEGNIRWSCVASARDGSGSYEVTVVGNDPVTIFSVTAVTRGVSEETATSYFSYVADLSLSETAPLETDAWMLQNVPAGGQTFTTGTEISVYGTKEAKALEIVASGTY